MSDGFDEQAIPETYDRYLAPLFFHPYAELLSKRLQGEKGRILDIACGTGAVTRHLAKSHETVGLDMSLTMLQVASQHVSKKTCLLAGDAQELPFADSSFGFGLCQFGIMFFPDKDQALREALRVLKPGGKYMFSVWDSLKQNPLAALVNRTVRSQFAEDPPPFFDVPFGYYDQYELRSILDKAGFEKVEIEKVPLITGACTPADAAKGVLEGNPILKQIKARDPGLLPVLKAKVEEALEREFGSPVKAPMTAIFCSGSKAASGQ
jgi:ubiquinone/menaquinone biosynthesis C-methylase UbiE